MSLINEVQLAELIEMAGETPPGAFVEVGVYRGGSAEKLVEKAREQGRALWLFDTFAGIPCKDWDDRHRIGDFADCSFDAVQARIPDALIVVGDCRVTLAEANTGPVAFAHIDCDQYASIKACIAELTPRMVRGGVMWFDDYGPGFLEGADRAVEEAFGDRLEHHPCCKHFVRF